MVSSALFNGAAAYGRIMSWVHLAGAVVIACCMSAFALWLYRSSRGAQSATATVKSASCTISEATAAATAGSSGGQQRASSSDSSSASGGLAYVCDLNITFSDASGALVSQRIMRRGPRAYAAGDTMPIEYNPQDTSQPVSDAGNQRTTAGAAVSVSSCAMLAVLLAAGTVLLANYNSFFASALGVSSAVSMIVPSSR